MKCPKCGYNSFEFHDACRKCGGDLAGHKITHGLKSMVIPQEARPELAAQFAPEPAEAAQAQDLGGSPADMFSFDLPEPVSMLDDSDNDPFGFVNEPAPAGDGFGDFSFDDEPIMAAPVAPPASAGEEDAFASLLESTVDDPFALPAEPAAPAPATDNAPGEFDFDSFSWDEPATASGNDASKGTELDSLFGSDEKK